MKFTLFVSCACALALACTAAPQYRGQQGYRSPEANAQILSYTNDHGYNGNYGYSYQTSNGIAAQENGYLKNPGTQAEAQVAQGSYSYTGPDGVVYTVNYIADENGYRATGAHLPTPPPVPEAIARSLAARGLGGNQQYKQQNQQYRQY